MQILLIKNNFNEILILEKSYRELTFTISSQYTNDRIEKKGQKYL